MRRTSCPLAVLTLLLFLTSTPARAADHFLTIGGGPSPSNNQVSLEKNVHYLQRLLAGWGIDNDHSTVFFADGNDPGRDLQYDDPGLQIPRANELLARLSSRSDGLYLRYRSSNISDVAGPATRKNLQDYFANTASKLQPNDRLFIYFTGHGGHGAKASPRNTTLELWGDASMPVTELASLLDKVPQAVPVVLVMVQCHAGGFADVIFANGQPGPALSPANRCGFFATLPERSAAGCTSDIDEEDYREYSTSFFSALSGMDRLGMPVEKPDYDKDNKTSFAEAHAFVLIHSDTIDIPLSTTDVFLRQFSKTQLDGQRLLTPDAHIDTLLKVASPAQRAVLENLSTKLRVFGPTRTAEVRRLAEKLDKDRKAVEQTRARFLAEYNRLRNSIRGRIRSRWPELSNPWNPRAAELLRTESDEVIQAIESHPQYKRWEQLTDRINEQDERLSQLERQWVKCQRFLYTADSVALAANLDKVAPEDVRARYQSLMAAEYGTIK